MKHKHKRLILIVSLLAIFAAMIGFMLYQLEESLIFFYSPSEIHSTAISESDVIRVGGLVKNGSVKQSGNKLEFVLTDYEQEVVVKYTGIIPQLFREGQGMVAVGHLDKSKATVNATSLLAKHDENYMPREVMETLKSQGHWQGEKVNK